MLALGKQFRLHLKKVRIARGNDGSKEFALHNRVVWILSQLESGALNMRSCGQNSTDIASIFFCHS